jgi:hypothetical protein
MHYTLAVIFPTEDKRFLELHEENYEEREDHFNEFFANKLERPLKKFLRDNSKEEDDGRFDYWGVYRVLTCKRYLSEMDQYQTPQMVLLPDTETLLESPEYFYSVDNEDRGKFNDWVKTIRETLAKYPISFIVLIDCHS